MKVAESIHTSPISTEKSVRGDESRSLTTCRAGKIVPVWYAPVLREDQVTSGKLRLKLDMAETIHPLMNAVNVTAYVHFIPFLAFDRFNGSVDAFNRSYQGIAEPGGALIPFFPTITYSRDAAFWRTMGIHWKNNTAINRAPVEAYNTLVNFRRKARSEKLPLRTHLDQTLAEAFWKNSNMWHVVPDFDQASMDGEVELQWADSRLPIRGIGRNSSATTVGVNTAVHEMRDGAQFPTTYPNAVNTNDAALRFNSNAAGTPEIFAELAQSGIRVSLANIELAKQTAAFAKLREKYSGLDDDHIIDLLMEGIRVPDEALKQPILLDRKSTIFGYSERHAMDGASLDMSVTTGETSLDLSFRTPPMNMGGLIMVTVEIVPEQLYERQKDAFLAMTSPNMLPNFMRDFLDPEKVSIVRNDYVDVEHATPSATFGYAPLNHEWKRSLTRIGGKYFRPIPDTFVEDRQRFWSVEKLNPTLTTDFYLVSNLPHNVFLDTISDPFEILTVGSASLVGNTVFGKVLEEDGDHYDSVMNQVDQSRIVQP